jgi:hypothetical protein
VYKTVEAEIKGCSEGVEEKAVRGWDESSEEDAHDGAGKFRQVERVYE